MIVDEDKLESLAQYHMGETPNNPAISWEVNAAVAHEGFKQAMREYSNHMARMYIDLILARDLEIASLKEDIKTMVQKAADDKLPAYREQGQKMAVMAERIEQLEFALAAATGRQGNTRVFTYAQRIGIPPWEVFCDDDHLMYVQAKQEAERICRIGNRVVARLIHSSTEE